MDDLVREGTPLQHSERVAVVTGAGNGQGLAVTQGFVSRGVHVVAVDLDCSRVPTDGLVHPCEVDLADPNGLDPLVCSLAGLGRCDYLYNNAAVYLQGRGDGPAHLVSREILDLTLEVNLSGLFRVTRAVLPHMTRQRSGVIVNVSSTGALLGSMNHAYGVSKGAVIGLTQSLAVTYGPFGIRAVTLSPGMVDTRMLHFITQDRDAHERTNERIPLRRVASPEEVAAVGLFLMSEGASYVNGANIVVDGGLTMA